MQLIYVIWLYLLFPPLWLIKGKYRQWRHPFKFPKGAKHRRGIVDELDSTDFWVHAVSAGEVNSAEPLIFHLLSAFPERKITLTCSSTNGIMHALQIQQQPSTEGRLQIAMMPFDYPKFVKRFLDTIRPKILIFVENDYFWPNLLRECHQRNIPMILFSLNIRKQTFLFHSYISRKLFPARMNLVEHIYAQGAEDRNRLVILGIKQEKITIEGNLKFTATENLKNKQLYDFVTQAKSHAFVWTAGSTYKGEEEAIWGVHRKLLNECPSALLIYAPRQALSFVDSGHRLAQYCKKYKLRYAKVLGKGEKVPLTTDIHILLINTSGVLKNAYAVSHAAFVGGSLIDKGGHNVLEPANFAVATLSGPHFADQYQIYDLLRKEQAIIICDNTKQLHKQVQRLQQDEDYRLQKGRAMKRVFASNKVDLQKFSNSLKQWF